MSRICKTFSQIASPTPFVLIRVINLSKQFNRFLYFEIIHVSDQLRSDQITIIYRVSSLMYHSSSSIYHASLIIQHLSCITSHLSSSIHHLSLSIYHLSSSTYQPASVISLHLQTFQMGHNRCVSGGGDGGSLSVSLSLPSSISLSWSLSSSYAVS